MGSPLVVITITYISGIAFGSMIGLPVWSSFLLIFLAFTVVVCLTAMRKNIRPLLVVLFFLLGLLNFQFRGLPPARNDISNFPKNEYVSLIGQVDDEPRVIDDTMFFTLRAKTVNEHAATGSVSVMAKAGDLEYGDRVEVKGKLEELESLSNPGLLSFADYLKNKGVNCRIRSSRAPPVLARGGGNQLKRICLALKNRLIVVPRQTLPEPYATLLASIVFGSRAASAPAEIKETYKRAGVAHLLVASGMHLGILIGVCLFIVRSSRLPPWLGILVTSLVNFLYAIMTGFGPSILRAAIMAQIMLAGLLFEREKEV
ncbi:ComEC/Rec2 family competence protein, partial [Candidatus Margulisiibacteriota bacterium]